MGIMPSSIRWEVDPRFETRLGLGVPATTDVLDNLHHFIVLRQLVIARDAATGSPKPRHGCPPASALMASS
jgi:hypothetical protein